MNSRTNHNLGIASLDTRYQPLDADLTAIAALGFTATAFLKKTAADTWALDTNTYSLSSHNHSGVYEPVLGNPAVDGYVLSSTVAGVRSWVAQGGGGGGYATIQEEGTGLTQRTIMNFIGAGITASDDAANTRTNITLDATLNSLSALGTAADKIAYTTGVDTWAETPLTAAGRSILDDADVGAIRTTLGVGTADSPTFAGGIISAASVTFTLSSTSVAASPYSRVLFNTSHTNAGARNWDFGIQLSNYGTLDFRCGATQGAAPSVIAAYFDNAYNLNLNSHRLYLNSAYLDGATAGFIGVSGSILTSLTISRQGLTTGVNPTLTIITANAADDAILNLWLAGTRNWQLRTNRASDTFSIWDGSAGDAKLELEPGYKGGATSIYGANGNALRITNPSAGVIAFTVV